MKKTTKQILCKFEAQENAIVSNYVCNKWRVASGRVSQGKPFPVLK